MAAFCKMVHTSNPSTLYAGSGFQDRYWLRTKHTGTHSGARPHVYTHCVCVKQWVVFSPAFPNQPLVSYPISFLGKKKREMPAQTSSYSSLFPNGFLNFSKSTFGQDPEKYLKVIFRKTHKTWKCYSSNYLKLAKLHHIGFHSAFGPPCSQTRILVADESQLILESE